MNKHEPLKWGAIGIIVGLLFNFVWAIIFWNSELFIWHWLAVLVSMGIVIFGMIKDFRR